MLLLLNTRLPIVRGIGIFLVGLKKKPSSNGPGKPNNNGSDGGGDDDNGMPQYPKTESVQETEKRIENIDEYIARMEESSDSEEEECEATE
jgi:hypothetical protein